MQGKLSQEDTLNFAFSSFLSPIETMKYIYGKEQLVYLFEKLPLKNEVQKFDFSHPYAAKNKGLEFLADFKDAVLHRTFTQEGKCFMFTLENSPNYRANVQFDDLMRLVIKFNHEFRQVCIYELEIE